MPTHNAGPETPKENREPSVAEISKLSPQQSVAALEDKLEEKAEGLEDLARQQKGRNKEIAEEALQSVVARLELVRAMA